MFPLCVAAASLALQPTGRLSTPRMQAAPAPSVVSRAPGQPSGGDADAFGSDPAGFCSAQLRKHGPVFSTGVAKNAIFVGDAASISAIEAASTASASAGSEDEACAPYARATGADPFAPHAAAFNDACYNDIFLWIPRYKEAGFSTFRFEDFIDGRVRRLVPSVRSMILHAAAPCLFGVEKYADLPGLLGFESAADLDKAYAAHAVTLRPAKFTIGLPSLFDLEGGGGDPKALKDGLEAFGRRYSSGSSEGGGLLGASAAAGASSGDSLLWELTSSVEQTVALAATMIAAASLHPDAAKPLAAEQATALSGMAPDAPITTETLATMPQLQAFTQECLRLYPPSRPGRVSLMEDLVLPTSEAITLPAGARVAPEPFVAHFSGVEAPTTFRPSRFVDGVASPPVLVPFGTAVPGTPGSPVPSIFTTDAAASGARLAVSMAQVFYVQQSRMFEEVILGANPPCDPTEGCLVRGVGEKVEVLLKPKMYYELQRGVKKLRF